MKTKKFWLPCIAAVAIATFVGAKSLRTNASDGNSLLLQNIEALAEEGDESAPEDDLVICSGPLWADSFIKSGKVTTIEHHTDTLDKIVVYSISKCCAAHQGMGELQGDNTIYAIGSAEIKKIETCQGSLGHRSLMDVIIELYK